MNNEEFQKLILEQFKNINDRFDKLENGQTELHQNQTRMEYELLEKIGSITVGQTELQQNQTRMEYELLEKIGAITDGQTELRQNQARMEYELLEKISAIADGQKVTDDKLDDFIISTNANLNFLVNSIDVLINKIDHINADTSLLAKRVTKLEKLQK